ncbi:ADP/ATP-dependent (S)-NAD(P)H-hydrate dehydratase [Microbacterium panaciterrae]|uniref:ADP-dependent (S)-NAD(P)H-hydrate dehydratase n=1 Tax=Microbacterium panaciterrae TaxID=985759 RepID=A0ABP8PF02_9MICO
MPQPPVPPVCVWSGDDARRLLRVPDPDADKRRRGVVALRAGSDAFPGAAVLGVEGAWRAGAGYVHYVGPRRAADLVLARRPETVATGPDSGSVRADAWVIGSGTDATSRTAGETAALRLLLSGADPVVVDAGALDLLPATAPVIATPHEREFVRLRAALGLSTLAEEVLRDAPRRAGVVQETADALGATVLLKGATTLIAAAGAGTVLAVSAGTPWLATAGTGDVLAGVIGALVAADRAAAAPTPLAELAATAAWLHGVAGRIAAGVGAGAEGRPIVALDVAAALPAAFARTRAGDVGLSENDGLAANDDRAENDGLAQRGNDDDDQIQEVPE